MTNDQKTLKTMLIGMALIISFSAAMHVYLLRKKAIMVNRYEPQYGNQKDENPDEKLLEGGGTRTGEVVAVSYDKFFLRLGKDVQPFAIGNLRMPEVGTVITVAFASGRPPQAVTINDEPAPEADSTPAKTQPLSK